MSHYGYNSVLAKKCLTLIAFMTYVLNAVIFAVGLIQFKEVSFNDEAFLCLSGGLVGQFIIFLLWKKVKGNGYGCLIQISSACVGIFGVKVFLDGIYAFWLSDFSDVLGCLEMGLGCLIVLAASALLHRFDNF